MVTKFKLVFALMLTFCAFGQDEQYIRPGMIKASATIAPSLMLNRSVQNIYINGFLAYQLDKKLSLRGESYFLINNAASKATDVVMNGAMHTYFGAFYHETKGNWDNYLGFQPGLSLIQTVHQSGLSACPSFSFKMGTAFYVWKYFHFFAELSYTNTTLRAVPSGRYRADELILSAGLGFQINTKPAFRTVGTPPF
jgi:hypothetical protein